MNVYKRKEVIGDCTLYLGDCLEVMRSFPPCFQVDAVITDPPFGVGNFVQITGDLRGDKVDWNESIPPQEWFEIVKRISKHRIIWGANFFNCFEGRGGAIVWDKCQPMPNFSKCDIASSSHLQKTELVRIPWAGGSANKETIHPCERPVSLYDWCINYLPDVESLIDPFLGSGSCGVAAAKNKKKFLGIEQNEKYFDIAVERITNAYRQERLFA